ncbi:MAG TPA: VOC family protein [Bryobacteraceae bacterium]|jgi:catechol 2,3-dioxygenase-like lactoylglutathione lyase family enzyme
MPRFLIAVVSAAVLLAQGPAPVPAGDIVGVGNFSHIVADLDKSLAFYRDVLGLETAAAARAFDPNPAIMKLGNTPGAQSRMVQLRVPGAPMGVEIIEYKDIERTPAHPRFQDPGAGNLTLRVRDLAPIMAKAKAANVHVLTAGGVPATLNNSHYVFLQDPDGFVVEIAQSDAAAPANAGAGNVLGGGMEFTVNNLEQTQSLYKALGFPVTAPAAFNGDKTMTETAGTPGAQFRQFRAQIPGTSSSMTFIEFKDIDRKPLHTKVQDPGTAILQLTVANLDTLMPKLKAAGFVPVSTGGEPAVIGGAVRILIVRDVNNLHLELIEQRRAPTKQ